MIDLYLRAPDQAALYVALEAAGLMVTDDSGARVPMQASHAHALDVIGDLVKTPAVMSADGQTVITPAVMVGAYHANLRIWCDDAARIISAVSSVTIAPEPAQKQRVWA